MAKPLSRQPSGPATSSTRASADLGPAASLGPAPDNGVPFTDPQRSSPARPAPVKRRGKQLGARIPDQLHARLVACADATRIPQNRLLERALDTELRSHGY